MVEINKTLKQLVVKVVYYGPALSGKTTNLMQLHDLLDPRGCGELMNFETRGDRTLFFDFLPVTGVSESGFRIKAKLFTVPGQVAHDATRKAVLSRADAVVFVADSHPDQGLNNSESFGNLEKNAGRVGLDFENLPLVIQYNKQDLPHALDRRLIEKRWQPTGLPVIFSTALHGQGVKETLAAVLKATYTGLNRRFDLNTRHGIRLDHFLALIPSGHGKDNRETPA